MLWQTLQSSENSPLVIDIILLSFYASRNTRCKQAKQMSYTLSMVFLLHQELLKVHRCFLVELKNALSFSHSQNLYQVFIKYKER